MQRLSTLSFALLFTLSLSQSSRAEELILSFPVLRNGQPVAGAPITLRLFDSQTGRLKPPVRLRTDAQGRINSKVEVATWQERNAAPVEVRPIPNDYLVVDAPNAPLLVAELNAFRPGAFRGLKELRLGPGKVMRGQVLKDGKGAAGAQVALTYVNGLPLNDPKRGVTTPQLNAQTGADGSFSLRPLQLEGNAQEQENGSVLASAIASLQVNGQTLRAGLSGHALENADTPPDVRYAARFALAQTWTARGRVVNALNRQPISGARVEAVAHSVWPIEPALSNAKGEWELSGIPPQFEFYAMATHPDFGVAWAPIGQSHSSIGPEERQAKLFTDVVLRMRPMTTLRGRVVDEQTGQFPVLVDEKWPEPPTVGAVYAEGATATRYNTFARGTTRAPIKPDGTFVLPVATGDNVVWPQVPFYEPVERGLHFQVDEKGAGDAVIKVRRQPYFVVRFEADNPEDLKGEFFVNGAGSGGARLAPSHLWAMRAEKWGQEMKARIKYGGGATFETTFVADPKNWPQIVKLPPAAEIKQQKEGASSIEEKMR